MIRLTRRVFTDLAIWMIGLGVLMGIVFPFFVTAMGLPAADVLTPGFFAASIVAGCIVGGANIGLARTVVGRRSDAAGRPHSLHRIQSGGNDQRRQYGPLQT